jgi:hypothetical protein
MNGLPKSSKQKRRSARERRRKGLLRKIRDIPTKLISSRFNIYQAAMAVVIAYVGFKVISRFFQ